MCIRDRNGTYYEKEVEEGVNEELDEYRQQLMEGVAETSEELMEKFFAEEPFTEEEIKTAIVSSIAKRDLMPVICGAIDVYKRQISFSVNCPSLSMEKLR